MIHNNPHKRSLSNMRSSLFGGGNKNRQSPAMDSSMTYSSTTTTTSSSSSSSSSSLSSSRSQPSSSSSFQSQQILQEKSQDAMEEQIFEQSNVLRQGVATLRQISMTIYDELRSQDSLMDEFTDDISKTQNSLQFTIRKIGKLAKASSSRHMCLMILFVVFVFVAVYMLIKLA